MTATIKVKANVVIPDTLSFDFFHFIIPKIAAIINGDYYIHT